MATISCPHCQAENVAPAAFCEKCGKALPNTADTAPQVISGDAVATTELGKDVQAQQLHKRSRQASTALFAVAILQTLGGIVLYFLFRDEPGVDVGVAKTLLVVNLILAVIYAALGIWARSSPLPAAIVGLVLFLTVIIIGAVAEPISLVQGIIVKIIVILVLIRAIQAGVKHRQLTSQASGPGQSPVG